MVCNLNYQFYDCSMCVWFGWNDQSLLQECQSDDQRQNLYSRFLISGRDITAFFTDSSSNCQNCALDAQNYNSQQMVSSMTEKVENFCSLVDRCGMVVLVDQVCFFSDDHIICLCCLIHVLLWFFPVMKFMLIALVHLFIEDQSTSSKVPINVHFYSSAKPWHSLFTSKV